MEIIIATDYEEMSRKAAAFVADLVKKKPNLVMTVPTGSTPLGMYRELVQMHREDGLDFSGVTFFMLDEYYGLSPQSEGSYYSFLRNNFLLPIGIQNGQFQAHEALSPNTAATCLRYEKEIAKSGGLDLVVLGIGHNGHIAFNEPGSPFDSRTRLVELSMETISANARFFKSPADVPRQALSMGLATITGARKVLLLANSQAKARAVAMTLQGPITTQVPASCLQRHPDFTVVLDSSAASLLESKVRVK